MADYCTAPNVKGTGLGRLDIDISDYDTDLGAMITGVSRAIDRHYGVVDDAFAQATSTTRYFTDDAVYSNQNIRRRHRYGQIDQVLVLDMPIISVSQLLNGDDGATEITSSQYRLQPRNGRWYSEIHLLSTATDGWEFGTDGEIAVTGLWGFTTAVPAEIREAAAYWVAWLFKNWQSGLQDSTANLELGSVSYTKSMPEPVKKFLPVYRIGVG